MNITIVGTGYVGLVTGTCLAELGNKVACIDTDQKKLEKLKRSEIPFYEPGLADMVQHNMGRNHLSFTDNLGAAMETSNIIFIAVGTPQGNDGNADLSAVWAVAEEIGKFMKHDTVVVDKSTVPVGTAEKVHDIIEQELAKRKVSPKFSVVSNPEFLKEGSAITDAMKPDRVIVGSEDQWAIDIIKELYRPVTMNHERFIVMDVASAEMTKYAANAMLATKISFMNEIARICEQVGADVNKVRVGIGSDPRIGYQFIYPGIGYGGSCFPKDVEALIYNAEASGADPQVLKAVQNINKAQRHYFIEKIIKRYGNDLTGRVFALWGLAFKPETDDIREAPALTVIDELTKRGAKIHAYDSQAAENVKALYGDRPDIAYVDDNYDALKGADALILVTEWKEFRSPDFDRIKELLKEPVFFDGRNQYNKEMMKNKGFDYFQIGVA